MEQIGGTEPEPTQYESPRDYVLHHMAVDGWGCASAGNVAAPTGFFCWNSIEEAELAEVVDAFSEEIADAGLEDDTELVGHWLLQDVDNKVSVTKFDTKQHAQIAYESLELYLIRWMADEL